MMGRLLIILTLLCCTTAYAQRSDGFFIQELCFIDPDLLKKLNVDEIHIEVRENNRKRGSVKIFLDSNQRLVKQEADYMKTLRTTYYASTNLTQYACPIEKPDYIKTCEGDRITKTENEGAYRITTYDAAGVVLTDRFKPDSNLLEISRQFVYSTNNLLDTVHLQDLRKDGSIDKREMYIYAYDNDRLKLLTQYISSSEGFSKAGEFKYRNFDCGLVKKMEGVGYWGQYKAETRFAYYSKGRKLD